MLAQKSSTKTLEWTVWWWRFDLNEWAVCTCNTHTATCICDQPWMTWRNRVKALRKLQSASVVCFDTGSILHYWVRIGTKQCYTHTTMNFLDSADLLQNLQTSSHFHLTETRFRMYNAKCPFHFHATVTALSTDVEMLFGRPSAARNRYSYQITTGFFNNQRPVGTGYVETWLYETHSHFHTSNFGWAAKLTVYSFV